MFWASHHHENHHDTLGEEEKAIIMPLNAIHSLLPCQMNECYPDIILLGQWSSGEYYVQADKLLLSLITAFIISCHHHDTIGGSFDLNTKMINKVDSLSNTPQELFDALTKSGE